MRYNPALDGVRAVAVLIVLAHHSWLLPDGWIGVDVFFVLSGYLITSILANEMRQTGSVDLRSFYLRRALRLTPPLLMLCLFQFARAPFTANPSEVVNPTILAALYLQNWNGVFNFGYPGVLNHTWSLAIEEQFYWLWPAALLLVARRRPAIWLGWALALVLVARGLCWYEGGADGLLQYTFLRPCGLLIGCLLALAPKVEGPRFAVPVMLVAILALASFGREGAAMLLFGPLVTSLLTAGVIVCADQNGFLSARPLRYVGRISYGLYLYSVPIFVLVKGEMASRGVHVPTVCLIPVVFVVAAASYEFIEKPCLGLKDRLGPRRLPVAVAAE